MLRSMIRLAQTAARATQTVASRRIKPGKF